VANSKNNLSSLLSQLKKQKITGLSVNKLLAPTSVITQSQGASEKAMKPASAGDAKTSAMDAKTVPTGINFGSPSNKTTSTSQSSSEWSNLLQQTASGGVASAFGGGGLGSIAGLGGLIAGIASLFGGGKSTPPPLVEFELPASQTQTVYVSSNGASTYQGSVTQQSSSVKTGGAMYISSPTPQPSSPNSSAGQTFQYQSTQIAQAVKTALLNSSSLNDVIADI